MLAAPASISRTPAPDTVRAIGKFLVFTFAGTWALWALVIRTTGAYAPSAVPPALALGGPVFLLGVFAPGLVALALVAWDDGRAAVGVLLKRIVHWRVDLRLYAFALLLMPLAKLGVAVLHRALTGAWPYWGETHPAVLVAATILSTLGQAGEEVGWRGYLLPRIAERTGLGWASIIVGIVWAAWHLPLFFAPGADTYRQSFPFFALQLMAYSIALAWLYWRSGGSLLLTMFMHSAFNNTKDIVPSAGSPGDGVFTFHATLVFHMTVFLLWVAGVFLLMWMRGAPRLIEAPADRQPLPAA
jgi:membrane protease YdiL (CAAX protease family)